jgi:hypothetical protein
MSSQKSPFINIQRGNDFLGAGMIGNFVCTDWCDQRTGNTEIFFSRVLCTCPIGESCTTENFKFSIFPNPSANGNVQYKVEGIKAEGLTLKIFDTNGKQVLSKELKENSGTLNTSLSAGNYFAKLILKSKIASVKMEVAK